MVVALANAVRTIIDPANETGHVGAWALDFGRVGTVHIKVIESLPTAYTGPPGDDEVFVWFGMPNASGSILLQAASDDLEAWETEKALRHHQDADRSSYIAAHLGLRAMLGAALGIPPRDVRTARGPLGKPTLCARGHTEAVRSGLQFNISHTRGLVAVALARRPVGIDVEQPRPRADHSRILTSVLAPESVAAYRALSTDDERNRLFYRFWTLGEAFIKATGRGISQGLHTFAFNPHGPPRLTRVTPGWDPIERWRFGQF